ncbi:glycosyltransferase, partial [uncultured Paraglaciecola sp.]|uniref:glycosyltransferase n=1 Tax=uncultured Paraglaciecola sp. TaxID=1765024 RepID=UPI0025D49076
LYINKNMAVVNSILKQSGLTRFYGPGYVDSKTLKKGLSAFVDATGPYDIVIIDAVTLFWTKKNGADPLKGSFNYFSYSDIEHCFQDMIDFFLNSSKSIPHKVFYPNFDPYNVSNQQLELLESTESYLLTRDSKFWLKKEQMEDLEMEKFSNSVNDNWAEFIDKSGEKIVSFHGTVGEDEFKYHPLEFRSFDVAVPGVGYYNRAKALDNLKLVNNGIKLSLDGQGIKRKLRSRFFLLTQTRKSLSDYQETFFRTIEDSKMCFTCGSALGYSIRKFVEIPSRGGVLLCKPFAGFKHVGYLSGKNCFAVEPDTIGDRVTQLLGDMDELERVARAGQEMVLDLHSFSSRVSQIRSMFESMIDNDFEGSEWLDGNLNIIKARC